MPPLELEFIHKFVPPEAGYPTTLLLLHGTGGDENDLISLGAELLPGAALLSPRGRVLEHGMPRFFRRFGEGQFDLKDLKLQTGFLIRFVQDATRQYGLNPSEIIAVGFSNGANIAGSLLLTEPQVLAGAILFHPMVPFTPASLPNLHGVPVLIAAGSRDPIANRDHIARLTKMLTDSGARISTHWHEGGHELGNDDVVAARNWLAQR